MRTEAGLSSYANDAAHTARPASPSHLTGSTVLRYRRRPAPHRSRVRYLLPWRSPFGAPSVSTTPRPYIESRQTYVRWSVRCRPESMCLPAAGRSPWRPLL